MGWRLYTVEMTGTDEAWGESSLLEVLYSLHHCLQVARHLKKQHFQLHYLLRELAWIQEDKDALKADQRHSCLDQKVKERHNEMNQGCKPHLRE